MNDPTRLLAGGVELLDRSIAYTLGSLQAITPAALGRPTPCAGWELSRLLTHMDDSLAALGDAAELGRVEPGAPTGQPSPPDPAGSEELIRRMQSRACALLGWSAVALGDDPVAIAEHRLSAGVVTATGALEITAHGWDVAQACGIAHPIPAGLARSLFAVAPLLISDHDRPSRFGPPVTPRPGASAGEVLVAFLGRAIRR